MGKKPARPLRIALEKQVVIAGNNDLVSMRQTAEPLVEVFNLGWIAPGGKKIPGVEKHIATRNRYLAMPPMGIAQAYQPNFFASAHTFILTGTRQAL